MDGVSIVIPCYNPPVYLMEAIASARAQRGCVVEVVLVDDGTNSTEGKKVLERARGLVDRFIECPNRGAAAARNTGFDASSHEWIIPLDSDDRLEPEYAAVCAGALEAQPAVAFAYADYRVFGNHNYVERLADYNLYGLLDQNVLTYAALIRKRDWAKAGGYDESMTRGYEDWEFWLNLGARGSYGQHVSRVLFGYRKHGRSLLDTARENHAEISAYIRAKHPELYEYDRRAKVKAQWAPAAGILASAAQAGHQSILDCQRIEKGAAPTPQCQAFLVAGETESLAPDSAELAALAVWGGHDALALADGSTALSRRGFERNLTPRQPQPAMAIPPVPGNLETIHRHLANAGLLSLRTWARHPLRSTARLIPLRLKERVNRAVLRISGRRVFDLSFYLQFQPLAVESGVVVAAPLVYMPERRSSRRRIGFVTPHLGPGGAERVLLDIAGALDPATFELFLIATQSSGDSWLPQWKQRVEHIYNLGKLVESEKLAAGVYSIAVNWELDALLVQNSLAGYSVLPQIKTRLPQIHIVDLIHAVNADWNLITATRGVDAALDVRVAISATVREELIAQGIEASKIRLILNGVDLDHFSLDHLNEERFSRQQSGSQQAGADGEPHRILFAGRLEAVKRPLLLPEIALRLRDRRRRGDFRFVVAGDGPEAAGLQRRVRTLGLEDLFEFRGQVADVAPDLAACEAVVLPSKAEGIPLIVLEAFAASRPVVASAVGGVPEVVTPETGIAVPPGAAEIQNFAAALDLLVNDPALRQTLGANGRRLVELRFDRRRAAEEYRALFE